MNKIIFTLCALVLMIGCTSNSGGNIIKTQKGVEYELVKKGNGKKSNIGDFVEINIEAFGGRGDLKFSSSEQGQPAIINIIEDNPNAPANPVLDVIKEMGVGDSIKLVATPEMMNNQNGSDTITYHIGMKKIYTEAEFKKQQEELKTKAEARYNDIAVKVNNIYSKLSTDEMKAKTITTDSGLKYILLEEGEGSLTPKGETIKVDYHGILAKSGEVFDSSFKRPMPFTFKLGVGQVIRGWDEGLALLKGGSKALLIIPNKLAYGDRESGIIKKGDDLMFYVEVK